MGSVSPPMVVLLAIVTFAYFKRVHTLRSDPRRKVSGLRQFSFASGVFLLIAEPLSPLGVWDELSFTIHMVEHLLIGDLAALLMVLGLTGPLIAPVMRNPVVEFVRPLANPIPALVIWIGNLYFWHLPFAFDAALNYEGVHVLQHIGFFSAGFGVWMAVFGPLPKPEWFGNIAKLVYIIVQRMAGVLLGNFFIFGGSVFYANYATSDNPLGMKPVADQSVAGAVMMAEGSFISFVLLGWLFFKAASEGEKSQQLIEHAQDHGVEISQARSDRAAAAGTTDLLRERISSGAAIDKEYKSDLS
ncbi:MAG: cytochrome c oxidase assembly protein [Solirubrobacterales bacterium]|nr:cytochrome c oxidase assembly protein [Solirubrobacterales bacterium]